MLISNEDDLSDQSFTVLQNWLMVKKKKAEATTVYDWNKR